MSSLTQKLSGPRRRVYRVISAILAAAAMAAAMLIAASPVSADLLPGTGWTQASLPTGYYVFTGERVPVSCVPGTLFCVAVVATQSGPAPYGDIVSTDGGQDWTGYTTLPPTIDNYLSLSCVSTTVCWLTGEGDGGQAAVAESTDGGQTWTDLTPAGWNGDLSQAIDCVTPTTCWVVGWDQNLSQPSLGDTPWMAETTDAGTTWSTIANLPAIPQTNPNGTYQLYTISCTSTLDCVAGGGLNGVDGQVQVISTTDGGNTWTASTDPTLQGLQDVFGMSCVSDGGALPVCTAVGAALEAGGPVALTSGDGGATWSGIETYDDTGWFSSVSCADALDCWAQGAGTSVALLGTADGGATWSEQAADTTNENGIVSCASASVCVSTPDSAIWYTSDGGGLTAAEPRAKQVVRRLPEVSGKTVWAQTGHAVTLTGQYQGSAPASHGAASITLPDGSHQSRATSIRLNHYYSLAIGKIAAGITKVTFTAGNAKPFVVKVHSHPSQAPTVRATSVHAGPAAGGNRLTITGTGFSHLTKVLFGAAAGTHVTVHSATKLTVLAPAGTGSSYVTVVTSGGGPSPLTGRAVYNWLKRPAISKLSPAHGRASGGTKVTITGANLAYLQKVYFGNRLGTHLVIVSPTEIKIVTPANDGPVNVRIVTAGGISPLVKADRFTF
jgi:photosystem II stability/assembly factor-like uncharacterized protein